MFDKIFDSVSKGISGFVLAWALPSAIVFGLFTLFIFPTVDSRGVFAPISHAGGSGPVAIVAIGALIVLGLSTVFAYTQLPIYRFLEGYTMPAWLKRRLYRRQIRTWTMLQRLHGRSGRVEIERQLGIEDAMLYPERREQVQATRLGNALRAMESYGTTRFGLDTQSLWYELLNSAPATVRQDSEQARASVDFFMSFAAHLVGLAVVAACCAPFSTNVWQCLIVAALAGALAFPAYRRAVKNVLEWRFTTQALVNLGRAPLAQGLGLHLPARHVEEFFMWSHFTHFTLDGDGGHWKTPYLDTYRLTPSTRFGPGPPAEQEASQVADRVGDPDPR